MIAPVRITRQNRRFTVETQEHAVLEGAAVIVATGATPAPVAIPGAHQHIGRDLGYSIATYAHLVVDKQVAVIGRTARALRGAAELARTARHVFVIASDVDPTAPLFQALVERPNVECLLGWVVKDVIGGGTLTGLVVEGGGTRRYIAVERAFADLGLAPNSGMVDGLAQRDEAGFIVVDERNTTSVPGLCLYAAGDVATTFGEHVVIAVGDGTRAAMSAYEFLLTQSAPPVAPVKLRFVSWRRRY